MAELGWRVRFSVVFGGDAVEQLFGVVWISVIWKFWLIFGRESVFGENFDDLIDFESEIWCFDVIIGACFK